ncbi:MAG: flagellar brake protein [Syntrophomonadaceae bacterium]|jgi:c-di-GMP-binding flagellar brake protein YcgR
MKIEDLKVNQLIEIEVLNGETTEYLPSRIEELKDKYIFISMPMSKGVLLPMHLGEEIKVILRGKSGTYGFSSKIVGRRKEPIPFLIIVKPKKLISIKQKRDYVRLTVALPVRFRTVNEEGEKGNTEEGVTVDISAGGVLFYTKSEIKDDQKVEIELQFSTNEWFSCYAHVVRIFERNKYEKNAVRIAVEFDNISETQRDRIFKYIFEKQREWIKKGILK